MATIAPPVQNGTAEFPPKARQQVPISQTESRERFSVKKWVRLQLAALKQQSTQDTVSFGWSLFVHIVLILILAIITTSLQTPERPILLLESDGDFAIDTMIMGESDDEAAMAAESLPEPLEPVVQSLALDTKQVQALSEIESAPVLPELNTQSWVPINLASTTQSNTSSTSAPIVNASGLFAANSMEGRSPENRGRLGLKNGASKESEAAVDAALEWFAAHQALDGSWSTEMTDKPCNGRCDNGTEEIGSPKRIAATGLALLCFLGAGHTHRQGPYKTQVYKALQFLTSAIKTGPPNPRDDREKGRFLNDGARYEMYEHGIAVLSLCEAYQMTADSMLRGPIDAGIEFIERSQHANGSWGYMPNTPGDLSIVGWQMMALKSAHQIGVKVRPEVIHRADKFLDSQQSEQGAYYGYRSTQREACTTAIGLLLRLYRGWPRTDPRILQGTQYISDLGPSIDGIYYNYYATQLLFQMKFDRWTDWNKQNRDYLVAEQAKIGHEKGSWYFGRNHFNQVGGRLYNTAMATLTLEVYYRLMPINHEVEMDSFDL